MLYIMRHGKTDWNVRCKLQGKTDIPLNDDGREMARKAGKDSLEIPFDVCYTSPLKRARETAEIFFEGREVPVISDDRLIEMGFGNYEGIERSFKIPNCPINVLFNQPEKYEAVENGESLEELYARTGDFIEKIIYPELKEGKNILIVGHAIMNLSIVCRIRKIPLEKFWSTGIENCRLMRLL